MQLDQRRYRHARRAERHPGAGGRIEHPCRHDDDHAGRHLDVNDITAGPPLGILAPNAAPIERVPAVMDFDFLPDMGRMTARLPSAARTGLFAGSDSGGERAAVLYTLIETAKLNGLDPQAYLRRVLDRIAEHPSNRLAELLPWNFAPQRVEHEQLAA